MTGNYKFWISVGILLCSVYLCAGKKCKHGTVVNCVSEACSITNNSTEGDCDATSCEKESKCLKKPGASDRKIRAPTICNTFTYYPSSCISGYNTKKITGISLSSCQYYCRQSSSFYGFYCKSIDYNPLTDVCYLSEIRHSQDWSAWRLETCGDYDHYSRLPGCDPECDEFTTYATGCIKEYNNEIYLGVSTATLCKSQCLNTVTFACRSFDYNYQDDKCHLSTMRSPSDVPSGYFYWSNCYLNHYSLYRRRYGCAGPYNTFIEYPDGCISGYNTEKYFDVSLRKCKDLCIATLWCRSFDFSSSGSCYLSDKRGSQVGGDFHRKDCPASGSWTYYEKP